MPVARMHLIHSLIFCWPPDKAFILISRRGPEWQLYKVGAVAAMVKGLLHQIHSLNLWVPDSVFNHSAYHSIWDRMNQMRSPTQLSEITWLNLWNQGSTQKGDRTSMIQFRDLTQSMSHSEINVTQLWEEWTQSLRYPQSKRTQEMRGPYWFLRTINWDMRSTQKWRNRLILR